MSILIESPNIKLKECITGAIYTGEYKTVRYPTRKKTANFRVKDLNW